MFRKFIFNVLMSLVIAESRGAYAQRVWTAPSTAQLSADKCTTLKNSEFLEIPLAEKGAEKFKLFYFTAKPIDPKLPWVLMMHGGPGVVALHTPKALASGFENFNLVMTHMRGAGCSAVPLDANYDKYLTTEMIVSDSEKLREHLGVQQWHAVFGQSYGTISARNYAARFPDRVRMLLLQGFDDPTFFDDRLQNLGRTQVLTGWIDQSEPLLKERIGADQFATIKQKILADDQLLAGQFRGVSSWLRWNTAGYKNAFERSRNYVLLFLIMRYFGVINPDSIDAAFYMFSEFEPQLKGHVRVLNISEKLDRWDRMFFTSDHDDYDNLTLADELVSLRSLSSVNVNDDVLSPKLCHAIPTVLVHGGLDFTTPLGGAYKAFDDEKCYSGSFQMFVVTGGGHEPLEDLPEIIPVLLTLDGSKMLKLKDVRLNLFSR